MSLEVKNGDGKMDSGNGKWDESENYASAKEVKVE